MTAADLPLPRAFALALWSAAHVRGASDLEAAVRAAHGTGHRHEDHAGADLRAWIAETSELPGIRVAPLLPRPGRILGLVGPPAAVSAALDAGQALVVSALGHAEHTLVPRTSTIGGPGDEGIVITWERHRAPLGATVAEPPHGSARPALLAALRRAADSSTHLDLVPDEAIGHERLPADWTTVEIPHDIDPADAHLLVLAARTLALTEAELEDDDDARTLHDDARRTAILRELRDAAGDALVEGITRASRRD